MAAASQKHMVSAFPSIFSELTHYRFHQLIIVFSVSAQVSYEKLGCYRDNWQEVRPLHDLLFTDRDKSSPKYSGTKYTKETYDRRYLEDLVRRCAAQCKEFGYEVFGIEKFGIN